MENRAHAVAAGLFLLLFAAAVILAGWWMAGKREATRDLVLVTQRNVTGLNPQSQVRFRGIRSGKVVAIEVDPQDRRNILVRARVARTTPLTTATTAHLNFLGVTGQAYVQLEDPGTSNDFLPVEGAPRIALQGTMLQTLSDRLPELLSQAGEVAAKLNRLLDERNLAAVERTLGNVATASEALREVPPMLAQARAAMSPQNIQRLQSILIELERTAGQTAPLTMEMRALVTSLTAASRRLDRLLADTGGAFSDGTLPRINALVEDLHGNSRRLGRLLEGLDAAPQAIFFGRPAARSGPGEPGFAPPAP